jgi:hypothetical protein
MPVISGVGPTSEQANGPCRDISPPGESDPTIERPLQKAIAVAPGRSLDSAWLLTRTRGMGHHHCQRHRSVLGAIMELLLPARAFKAEFQ